jgi:ABC-type dipeptide/oligopeptide/nickel transport system permease component
MLKKFIAKRIAFSVFVLLVGSVITFSLLHLMPEDLDPAQIMAGPMAGPELVEDIREDMGLDKSIIVQYFEWLGGAFTGDLGHSWTLEVRSEVSDMIWERLPRTIVLSIAALLFSVGIGIPLGVIFTLKCGKWVNRAGMGGWLLAFSLPIVWLALMVILFFGVWLGWAPALGGGVGIQYLILPALTLSAVLTVVVAKSAKSDMMKFMGQASTKAKTKRARRRAIIHTIVKALTVTYPRRLPLLFGLLVLIEVVFGWPGIGGLMFNAVRASDFLVFRGVLWVFIVLVVIVNLIGEIAYAYFKSRYVEGR